MKIMLVCLYASGTIPEHILRSFTYRIIAGVVLVVTAAAFSSLGLFFSSVMRRTSQATALATVVTVVLVVGIPIFMFIVQGFLSTMVYLGSRSAASAVDAETLRNVVLWLLVSLSPLSAGVVTLAALVDSQSVFTMTWSASSGPPLILPAPWISYSVFYLLLSVVLVSLSIRAVKRVDK